MTTIVTRIGKGSALTFAEGDANFTNLNNDKLEDITNESIGDLSNVDLTGIADSNVLVWDTANSKFVASTVPVSGTTTGSVTAIDDVRTPNTLTLGNTTNVGVGNEIIFEGADVTSAGLSVGTSYYIAADIGGGAFEISSDSGGSNIVSLTNFGTINDFTYTVYTELRYNKLSELEDTSITSPSQNQYLQYINGQWENQDLNLTALTSNLDASSFEIQNAALIGYNEVIHSLGATSGTISPDISNGNVQTITLNGNITIDGFTNASAGDSVTIIIDNGTGGYSLSTNTMMFSNGGDIAITGTSGAIDILTIFYDGTNYYASLGKDFL